MSRLLQAIHFFSGCRGAIVWEGSFLGQGRSDYDCFEAWGFVVPFHLKGPIHLFNIGQWSKEMRQIPLRADPAFARRVYFHDWLWTLRPVMATRAPSSRNPFAAAKPIPLPPPVTRTTLPVNRSIIISRMKVKDHRTGYCLPGLMRPARGNIPFRIFTDPVG